MTPETDLLTQFVALLLAHKWLPLATALVGFGVRLVKPDTTTPVDISARWRPLIALGLGQAYAVLELVLGGAHWKEALTVGLTASVGAILGHVFGIEVLRDGKELPVPGLMRTPKGPPGGAPPPPVHIIIPSDDDAPSTMRRLGAVLCVALAFVLCGCAALRTANEARLKLCDLLSEEHEAQIVSEGRAVGLSPVDALRIFQATCLIRTNDENVVSASLGAVRSRTP